jgi:hypothetical protein
VVKSIRMQWTGNVASNGEEMNAHMVLTGNPSAARQLGRPKRRWEDSITLDLKEIGLKGADCTSHSRIRTNGGVL